MHKSTKILIAALAALLGALSLQAQDVGLTLEKALEIALLQSPEILAAKAELDAARGRSLQFGARPEPLLSGSLEGAPLPGSKKEGDQTEVHLGIQQVLEYPGKRSLRKEFGQQGEGLADAEFARVTQIVFSKVKKAYWRAVFAREAETALEKSAKSLAYLLADLEAKYRSGGAEYADIIRIRAEKARLQNLILEQGRERQAAGLELSNLMGRSSGEPPDLLTRLPFEPISADIEGLWESARATRPSFRIAALRMERAGTASKLARLNRRPDFVAGLLFPSVRTNAWGVSFGLTMPFLRPSRAKGQIMEAGAEAAIAQLASDALARRVRTAIESTYASAKAAEKQVLVYEQSLLRELEDEIRIQLEYFRYGKVEAFSLLDLHRTFVLAQIEHLRARFLYNIALADLEVAGEEAN